MNALTTPHRTGVSVEPQYSESGDFFFCLPNEGISIVESPTRLGLPIPEKLRDILVQPKVEGNKNRVKLNRMSAFNRHKRIKNELISLKAMKT